MVDELSGEYIVLGVMVMAALRGVGQVVMARRQGSGRELSIAFLRWWYRAGQGKGGAGLQEAGYGGCASVP